MEKESNSVCELGHHLSRYVARAQGWDAIHDEVIQHVGHLGVIRA